MIDGDDCAILRHQKLEAENQRLKDRLDGYKSHEHHACDATIELLFGENKTLKRLLREASYCLDRSVHETLIYTN